MEVVQRCAADFKMSIDLVARARRFREILDVGARDRTGTMGAVVCGIDNLRGEVSSIR